MFALERLSPYEQQWLRNDKQILPDLAHTLLSTGFSLLLIVVTIAAGVPEVVAEKGGSMWPDYWPLPLQILLGLMGAEVGIWMRPTALPTPGHCYGASTPCTTAHRACGFSIPGDFTWSTRWSAL